MLKRLYSSKYNVPVDAESSLVSRKRGGAEKIKTERFQRLFNPPVLQP